MKRHHWGKKEKKGHYTVWSKSNEKTPRNDTQRHTPTDDSNTNGRLLPSRHPPMSVTNAANPTTNPTVEEPTVLRQHLPTNGPIVQSLLHTHIHTRSNSCSNNSEPLRPGPTKVPTTTPATGKDPQPRLSSQHALSNRCSHERTDEWRQRDPSERCFRRRVTVML